MLRVVGPPPIWTACRLEIMAGPPSKGRSFAFMVRMAYVSTYSPRRCGIATFTGDLSSAAGSREIVALHAAGFAPAPYPVEVHHRIRRDEQADYVRTARALEACVAVVSIQHEYGIWGGVSGGYVVDFARALNIPSIATLHTVLPNPSVTQREIISALVASASATVVMSQSAADRLRAAYGVDLGTVSIIPHGVPDVPLVDPDTIKPAVGLAGRPVILSFGLLGPGKGLELVLDALPAVVAAHPTVCYVIAGATHPDMLLAQGEAYRQSLQDKVAALGLEQNVLFHDRFMGRTELLRWLEAADVFVTPYPNLDQIVSGTLAYAMGAGRAIVSTPYTYAAELLSGGHGVLVPVRSPEAWASALIAVLDDHDRRAELGRMAYEKSRAMVWSRVADQYRALSSRVAMAPVREPVRAASSAINA